MRNTARNWPAIIEDLDSSGLSAMEYSKQSGIPYSTIMRHRKHTVRNVSVESMGFIRLETQTTGEASAGVRIRIGKAVIEVDDDFSQKALSSVIEVLHACS